jgi:putative restriction endonuclease
MRRDLHALFDIGYITITPEYTLEVSCRIKEEFENGREYYRYNGSVIRIPPNITQRPAYEFLEEHNENIYRGPDQNKP